LAAKELGEKLKKVREMKGRSLAAVAEPAQMSATYLQKLERGEVEEPSPHRLFQLSRELEIDYAELMRLAGYVVPSTSDSEAGQKSVSLLAQALSAEDLSEDEVESLAEYLAFQRQRAKQRG
jgi:HTH-type transcriptional regulator, competence development regulator